MTIFNFEFEIKVTSGTMPDFLLDNCFLLNLGISVHKHVYNKRVIKKTLELFVIFYFVNTLLRYFTWDSEIKNSYQGLGHKKAKKNN